MSDPMKAIFAAHLGRAPPNKTSKLLRHRSEAPGAVTGHCDTFSKTLEGLCPRGPPSGSLQSVRGDAAMENKYAEVNPRNFNPTWAPRLSDEARKAVNDAFDAMSAWRIEAAKNNERNSEQVIEKLAAAARALGWPEQIVDATRAQMQGITKMQIQTMDQMMDAWEEQIRSPNPMAGSPSAMLSKLTSLAGAGPAGSWPSASALGATNPMEFWMQWAEQWQKAWTDAMALWSKAGQPDYGVGSRRR